MTADRDADALARECAAVMLARDRATQSLGIEILEMRPGFARLAMTISAAMINGHGVAHGGAVFTLADTAFAYACNARDVPHIALDASISFTAPARVNDRLEAVAVERALGGRTGVYDVTVTRESGDVVAVFRGTSYRIHGSVLGGEGA